MDGAAQLQGDCARDGSARRRPLSRDDAAAHGESATVNGTYKEITPPERIVFTWKWEGEQMGALPETLVTVTFTERQGEQGAETEVQLLHSGFPAPEARDAHNGGWQGCLNKLVDFTDSRGTAASLTLIGDSRSTYVRTVRMALVEKGLEYTYDPAPPHSPPVDAISPYGRVPVFRDGETALFETSAIVRYLDETFDGTPLRRAQPAAARADGAVGQHDQLPRLRRDGPPLRAPVRLSEGRGRCAGPQDDRRGAAGDRAVARDTGQGVRQAQFPGRRAVTMADLFLAPIVFYLGMFPESKALLEKVPNLSRAHAAIAERESFKATMPKLG